MPDPSDQDSRKRGSELEDLARDEVSLLSALLAPNPQDDSLRQSLMLALGLEDRSTTPEPPQPAEAVEQPAEALRHEGLQDEAAQPGNTGAHSVSAAEPLAPDTAHPTCWPTAGRAVGATADEPHALVVDDTEMVRDHTVALLERLGYVVTPAENGPTALRLLQSVPRLDLLVTDVVMPLAMNGRELADKVNEQFPGTATVYVSGFADLGVEERVGLPATANLLAKPFTRDEFNTAIAKAVYRARGGGTPSAPH